MDILVSSNLERLLFEASNRNCDTINKLMEQLNKEGIYTIDDEINKNLKDFYGDFANKEEVYEAIKNVYKEKDYLIDTHTAVAYVVLNKYINKTKDNTPYLIASTANPYKFPRSILKALDIEDNNLDDFEIIKKLNNITKVDIPKNLINLDKKDIIHNDVCEKDELVKKLLKFLEVKNYV